MFNKISFKPAYSSGAIVIIALALAITFFAFNIWKQNRITLDVPSYYAYLPSAIIYHDLKLNFIDKNPRFFSDKIWFYKIANGNRLIKCSMGVSVAFLPFFLMGHLAACIFGFAQDGYSLPYQNALSIGVIIYFLIGLHYLRKALLLFFSDKAVALTLLSVVMGTNLLWYLTFEGLMSHGISFSILSISIYSFFIWLEKSNRKYLMIFSIAFGLILLIRPLSVTLLFYFLIYGIINKGGIKKFYLFMRVHFKNILIGVAIVSIIFSPQLFYWKYIAGHWFFDAYIDEYFIFNRLEIFSFLFSFRKGWLIYTPIMFFAVIGFIFLFKKNRALFFATLPTLLITIYLFSSWWAWSYGICWGMRPMIDSYSYLSFPMAAAYTFILSRKKIVTYLLYVSLVLLIALNLFQTWQYKKGLIHFDYMTKKSYFLGFFQTKADFEWYDSLSPYDWNRHIKGLPQIDYSKDFFDNIQKTDLIYLRGHNLLFLLELNNPKGIITCTGQETGEQELFHLYKINGDTVAIQTNSGKFLSVKNSLKGLIIADKDSINNNEKFILTVMEYGDNRIKLKTLNGEYVSINPKRRFALLASQVVNSPGDEIFRLFILEK